MEVIEAAARRLKVDLCPVGVRELKELESAFSSLAGKRAEALVVYPDGMFQSRTSLIVALAARRRFPALYGIREYIEAVLTGSVLGGQDPQRRQALGPAGRAADEVRAGINLKTAGSLRLTIPQVSPAARRPVDPVGTAATISGYSGRQLLPGD